MPARPRRTHTYTIEPAPVASPAANWLTTLGGVPIAVVLTALVSGIGFYSVTNYKLADFDKEIASLKVKIEASGPALAAKIDGEATQRAAVRNEFLANQKEMTSALGAIGSRLAVSETKLEATNKALDTSNQTLSKIADQLQLLNSRSAGAAR